jgi:hypothetical protein
LASVLEDLLHWNIWLGCSWFQTPNSYDAQSVGQHQRSQIRNIHVAAGWLHVFRPDWIASITPFYRRDRAQYSSLLAILQPMDRPPWLRTGSWRIRVFAAKRN